MRKFRAEDRSGLTSFGWVHATPDGKTVLFRVSRILTDLYTATGIK
jgi:hypothetical protein